MIGNRQEAEDIAQEAFLRMRTVAWIDVTYSKTTVKQGETFAHTFDEPGRFPYHCLPHPMMRGLVVVEE